MVEESRALGQSLGAFCPPPLRSRGGGPITWLGEGPSWTGQRLVGWIS